MTCKYNVITRNLTLSDTVCVHPWFNLYIGPAGDIQPCCDSDHSMSLGNIKNNSISEIVNSDKFINVQKLMLSRKRPPECSRCYNLEDQGIESKRNKLNAQFKQQYKEITTKQQHSFNANSLDLNLGNTCNFKCRMCTGFSSSKLRSEEIEINTHGIEYSYIKQHQIKNRINEINNYALTASRLSFAGGESLLINEYNNILDFLITNNRIDIELTYSTNLSVLPEHVLERWKYFKNINVIVSIDATSQYAEYYRNGTIWNDIVDNFLKLQSITNVKVAIRSTISIYNAFAMINFQKQWIQQNKMDINNTVINVVEYPDYLTLQVLPVKYKNKLNDKILKHIDMLSAINANKLIHQWTRIQQFMYSKDTSHKLKKFFSYTDKLDKHRGENFSKIFKEYINLRNHVGE